MQCTDLDRLRAALDPDIPDDDLIDQAIETIRAQREPIEIVVLYRCRCGCFTIFEWTPCLGGSGFYKREAVRVIDLEHARRIYSDVLGKLRESNTGLTAWYTTKSNGANFIVSGTEHVCRDCETSSS